MFVFVGGLQRSGSTFAFNIARDILQARGLVYQEAPGAGDVAGAIARAARAEHLLIKAHEADSATLDMVRRGEVRTICTVRRIEDAAASWLETFDTTEAETIELLRRWLALYGAVRHAALIVPFAQVDHAPWLAAWRIARFVCPTVGMSEVVRSARMHSKRRAKRLADSLTPDAEGVHDAGSTYYDRATFLHRRHVSSLRSRPATARLAPDQLDRIRVALSPDIARAQFPAARSFWAAAQIADLRAHPASVPGRWSMATP